MNQMLTAIRLIGIMFNVGFPSSGEWQLPIGGSLGFPSAEMFIFKSPAHARATSRPRSLHAHRIVCVGDSITEGFANPNNWPHQLKTRLDGDWEVVNRGVGGDKTADMLARINDALYLEPHFVIIMGGTNDLASGEVALTTTQANIRAMCDRVESHGAVPVLCTVPPTKFHLARQDTLNGWITEYAHLKGYPLIDFYAVIDDPSHPGYSNPTLVMSDGVHPNAVGYTAMGNAIDLTVFTKRS